MRHFVHENNPSQVHRDVYSISYSATDANGHESLLSSTGQPGERMSTASSSSTTAASGKLPVTGTATGNTSSGNNKSGPGANSDQSSGQQAQLISRSTQQTKTQQTKTITKTIVQRETRFIGPDGRPIDLDPYGSINHNSPGQLNSSSYSASAGGPVYGNADAVLAAAAAAANGYVNGGHNDYNSYPANFPDYPMNPPSPPSLMSESPPPLRREPSIQGPQQMVNHLNNLPLRSGYDELDATLGQPTYSEHHRQPPHPPFITERDPYGYSGGQPGPLHPSAAASIYGVYGTTGQPGQGAFIDRRPSYVEDAINSSIYGGSIMGGPDGSVINGGLFVQPTTSTAPVPGPSTVSASGSDIRWRNPDLHEVIEFLSHPEPMVRANAAAYLGHLCFMDDNKKQKTRLLGGIPLLISLLTQEGFPEVQKNACGALKNLSYGRKNDENKRAIRAAGGIPILVNLLRLHAQSQEITELVTGILWNLSSCEDLKKCILDESMVILVKQVIIPCSRWDLSSSLNPLLAVMNGSLIHQPSEPLYWSNIFKNSTGVLRNISSGEYARRRMRECEYFVESLIFLVRTAITRNDMDNKSIENCVCILRNLSYRCQEIVDPNYDSVPMPQSATAPGTPTNSGHGGANGNVHNSLSPSSSSRAAALVVSKVGDNLGCFGSRSKKDKCKDSPIASSSADHLVSATANMTLRTNSHSTTGLAGGNSMATLPRSKALESVRGYELLWQPEIVQPYLALLSGCSNPETLEAAAGAIQNLSACYWQPSVEIRAAVRKEKGLPVLVELLRMEVDRVVCAVATALRNLAMDSRNKELIGKYAMKDLVSKLPNGNAQHDYGTSDDTIAAVLATLNEVISKNADFAKSLLEAHGMERLSYIIKNKNNKFSPRVFKFTSQLLFNMWQHSELREAYKKAGYKESHFIIRPPSASLSRNTSNVGHGTPGHNNTLSRPMSTQSGTRYEDRTLPRTGARSVTAANHQGGQGHATPYQSVQRVSASADAIKLKLLCTS